MRRVDRFPTEPASDLKQNISVLRICHGGLSLKTSSKTLALFACLVVLSCPLFGQEGAGGGSGVVAVLDVALVFEKNPSFKQRMDALTAEADQFKAKMEAEQSSIRKKAEQLNTFAPDSIEYRQLESELAQQTTTLQTLARQTNNDFLNREAQVYFETYTQMQQVVAAIAAKYNICLVLKFESTPIDSNDRGDVIKGVNRNIVYQKELDLTDLVIRDMGAVSSAAVPGNIR
jgi:Skp family chaperone for outer membrane proteins